MTDMDPLMKLSLRIINLQRIRDELEASIKKKNAELVEFNTKLEKAKKDLAEKKNNLDPGNVKLKKVDALIEESQKALSKIVKSSLSVEKLLDKELFAPDTIKTAQ